MGPDKIIVGDGNALDITHIGSTNVKFGDASLQLDIVLVVPSIKKNLLSVSQMTTDYPYVFEFSSDGFVIKHKGTQKQIAMGSRRGDLYASSQSRMTSDEVCHQQLGHQQMRTIEFLAKKINDF